MGKMTDYEWIDRGRRREQILVSVMNKPRMPSEAREILGYNSGNKLSITFQELMARHLVRELAKDLYGLTYKGQRLRKKLLSGRQLHGAYTEPCLDWKSYRWVISGRQRKTLVRVMERHPIIAARLLRLARQIHAKLSRTDTYNVLKQCKKKRLANASKQEKNILYSLTGKGDSIKKQMLTLWFALFLFFRI